MIDLSQQTILMETLPTFLAQIFPSWRPEDVVVKPVSGGITNMLVKCVHSNSSGNTPKTVLVRSYGDNTDLIIDRHSELQNHIMLNKLNLAPTIYARASNGIVYGYLSGRSLSAAELCEDQLYPLISEKLGYWHTTLTKAAGVEQNDLWKTLEAWIEVAPENALSTSKLVLREEVSWMRDALGDRSKLVRSHCDLLSGNIVIPPEMDQILALGLNEKEYQYFPQYNLRLPPPEKNTILFIDYEYMLRAPRGFDIANHLAEWQGFECDTLRILQPCKDNQKLRKWCFAYIYGERGTVDERIEEDIDLLIDEIYSFFGVPAFYWGVWAAIQSKISSIDFDYAGYGLKRLEEYFEWKKKYVGSA